MCIDAMSSLHTQVVSKLGYVESEAAPIAMDGESPPVVTDAPVEFEKELVEFKTSGRKLQFT